MFENNTVIIIIIIIKKVTNFSRESLREFPLILLPHFLQLAVRRTVAPTDRASSGRSCTSAAHWCAPAMQTQTSNVKASLKVSGRVEAGVFLQPHFLSLVQDYGFLCFMYQYSRGYFKLLLV